MKNLIFLLVIISTSVTFSFKNKKFVEIPAIFSDNMVLQQKVKAPFWGKAVPGEIVLIRASWGGSAKAKVQPDSLWSAKIQTPRAGGPYQIKIKIGDSSFTLNNVLIGEVWLCSGQSNMEMPMEGFPPNDTIIGAQNEIKNGRNFALRFFTVERAYSDRPQFNGSGNWLQSSPEAVAKFSAAGFFFGKKLSDELKVPIGLINASWGGTAVESWLSKKYLGFVDEYKELVTKIEDSGAELKKLYDWLERYPVIDVSKKDILHKWEGLNFKDDDCSLPVFDDSRWKEMYLPVGWEITEVGNFDGTIWFRRKIEIPKSWLHKDLVLTLGPIDDMDVTYVNGKKVGGYETDGNWQTERIYEVSKEVVNDSSLTIAVRVVDNQGGGGLYGSEEQLNIHLKDGDENISLSGEWKYLPVAEYRSGKFFVFGSGGEEYYSRPVIAVDLSANTPTALYNAMIAPLIPYAIKGAIWYQGESNAWKPDLYQTLFSKMIEGWRADWREGNFPFYFVQIAPFKYDEKTESQKLREQQLLTLALPNTGMAVTLDIGNPENVHPANKKEVGDRLAFWALAKNYHKKVFFSGPLYKSQKISRDKIILSFEYVDGGLLITEDKRGTNFLIAGEDRQFKKADIKIEEKKLVLSNSEIKKPVAVRYAWSNTAEATLFNKKHLPASSFRTDNWKK
ncbi:MAG: glycosyl hydrolase family 2 [Ignavibacteria bacterium CG_4_8_14_3_um_filter_37_9]|nr:MAG: glycosyl hydrolase family 2 [Ignavibacteria bacterium CG_4_8_14_3_um_filter_37_9]